MGRLSSGAISGIIGGSAAITGALVGTIGSSVNNKKARKLIDEEIKKNQEWYDTKMSEDYTLRSDVQATINKQRELLNEQYSNARARSIVGGGTEEAMALQQAAANRSLSDTMGSVAANASAYKDNVEAQYRSQDAALAQQKVQSYQQQAQQFADAGSQMVQSGLSTAAAGLTKANK